MTVTVETVPDARLVEPTDVLVRVTIRVELITRLLPCLRTHAP